MANSDPVGNGLLMPFRRDEKGDFANGSGLDVLRSDIGELLGLIGPTATEPGELSWDTSRGANFMQLKHRHLHSEMVAALADQIAAGVLMKFEPRVRVGRVRVTTQNSNTLKIQTSYRPLGFVRGGDQSVTTEV